MWVSTTMGSAWNPPKAKIKTLIDDLYDSPKPTKGMQTPFLSTTSCLGFWFSLLLALLCESAIMVIESYLATTKFVLFYKNKHFNRNFYWLRVSIEFAAKRHCANLNKLTKSRRIFCRHQHQTIANECGLIISQKYNPLQVVQEKAINLILKWCLSQST